FPYGRDGYVFAASSLRLDVLSLKCRVVRELRKADPAKARELFRQCYRDIKPPAASCETSLVFDPSLLESTLENLLVGLRGDALAEELSDYAGAMVSGVQIPGFVRLLLENSAAPQDHGLLLRMSLLIAQRLRELEDGDRAFVYATGGLRLVERVGELARQLRQSGMSSEVLVSSLRTYLRRHFTQERCADTPRNSPQWRAPKEIADAFREVVRDAGVEIEPLAASEMQPVKSVAPAEVTYFGNRREVKDSVECLRSLDKLRSADPSGERRSEWIGNLDRCFSALRTLAPATRAEQADVFRHKANLYRLILDMAPPWWDPRAELEEWLALLENSPLKTESPMEWLWELQIFLDLARELTEERRAEFERLQKKGVRIPGLPGPHRQAIWERVRGSKDPVVALYGMLEAVAPLKWGAWRAR
ncbi:MAG TPA: hypothetical protein VNJ11_04795, partial [Bryobacteraceae bacterium]|nr:hypothetical protein [Bryobacteraceae bacterium]